MNTDKYRNHVDKIAAIACVMEEDLRGEFNFKDIDIHPAVLGIRVDLFDDVTDPNEGFLLQVLNLDDERTMVVSEKMQRSVDAMIIAEVMEGEISVEDLSALWL